MDKWVFGVGTLLAFECYLGIGELASLTFAGSVHRGLVLRLANTKISRNQLMTVKLSVVSALFQQNSRSARPPGTRIRAIRCSSSIFRNYFMSACTSLDLSSDYVLHSLCHGSATDS